MREGVRLDREGVKQAWRTAKRPMLWCAPFADEATTTLYGAWPRENERMPDEGCDVFVVIGGGKLIDRAKLVARARAPNARLIAIPTLYGSGAEVSPVAVENAAQGKIPHLNEALVPDAYVHDAFFLETLSDQLALNASGDVLSHALEAFLSPLASDNLRKECAHSLRAMMSLPLAKDARWFEHGANAVRQQAQASVGLIHGIAHTLEDLDSDARERFGHAGLCRVMLFPVLSFDLRESQKATLLFAQHGLDEKAVLRLTHALFEREAFVHLTPALREHWSKVVRNPCSRTNVALVRPSSLDTLLETVA